MNERKPPRGFDALFAIIFLAIVAAGSWWFLSMTNTVFSDALLAHMVALMRGVG